MTTQLSWDLRIALCDWVCFPGTSAQVGLSKWQPSSHQHQYPPSSSSTRDDSLGLVNPLPACGREHPNVISTHAVGPIQENSALKIPTAKTYR